jgi:hypothetical protein
MKPTSKPMNNAGTGNASRMQLKDLKSAYTGLQPDEWAVTRLRARIRSEKNTSGNEWADSIGYIFKRYVLATSVIVFTLTAMLQWRTTPQTESFATDELESWLFGDFQQDLSGDVPEITLLMEL